MDKGFSKAKKIVEKFRKGLSISQIAKEEGINRYSVSLVKQTMELLEEENQDLRRETNFFLILSIILLIALLGVVILCLIW